MTQPQGHSTSGSHERYKPKARLAWEKEFDCNRKMREWMLNEGIGSVDELDVIEKEAKATARAAKEAAWRSFNEEIQKDQRELSLLLEQGEGEFPELVEIRETMDKTLNPLRLDAFKAAKKAVRVMLGKESALKNEIVAWIKRNTSRKF